MRKVGKVKTAKPEDCLASGGELAALDWSKTLVSRLSVLILLARCHLLEERLRQA